MVPYLDKSAELPPGTKVISCCQSGVSQWTVTAKITSSHADGRLRFYFLKLAENAQGKGMLEGEYHSMNELHKAAPNLVPEPHAWEKLSASPSTYYFLCDFIEMTNERPDPVKLCTKLVAMQHAGKSPTGQFGFHINTCQGNLPQQTAWNSSWADYYIQLVKGAMQLNWERCGSWKNLEQVVDHLITHVVPLVLRPLEAGGRSVKPTLVHGDLWDGNVGADSQNGEIYVFDASAYYGHHEMDVAIWRSKFSLVLRSSVYLDTYLSLMGMSEPQDQFDDRNRIYSCCLTLHASAYHGGSSFREQCYENMVYLIDKYAPFPDDDL